MTDQVARQGLWDRLRPSVGIAVRGVVVASALFLFTAWNANSALAEDDAGYPAEYNAQCNGTENTSHTISSHDPYKIDYAVRDAWCLHIKELVNNQSPKHGLIELQALAGLGEASIAHDAKAAFYVGSDSVRTLYPDISTFYQDIESYQAIWSGVEEWAFDMKSAKTTIASAEAAIEGFKTVLWNIKQEEDPVDKWPRSMFVHPFDFTSHAQISKLSFDVSAISIAVLDQSNHSREKRSPAVYADDQDQLLKNLRNTIDVTKDCLNYTSRPEWNAPRHYARRPMEDGCNIIQKFANALSVRVQLAKECNDGNEDKCSEYQKAEAETPIDKLINEFSLEYREQENPGLNSFLNLWDEPNKIFWQPKSTH